MEPTPNNNNLSLRAKPPGEARQSRDCFVGSSLLAMTINQGAYMKKIFSFIVLSFFISASVGCGAISLNQKKKWPKAPTIQDLQQRQTEKSLHSPKGTMEPTTTPQQAIAISHPVYFANGSQDICPDQKVGVLNWLNNISDFKNQKYSIVGSATGINNIVNKKCSVDRAYSVKNYLLSMGINPDNISASGKGGSETTSGKDRNAVISVATLRRFDADIPLIPSPTEGTLAENDSRLISLSEPARYSNWNKFPTGYEVKQCGPICIAEKKIDDNTFDIIISIHESLIPEGATQFMPLGVTEGWKKGNSVWPTPMWRETLQVQPAMFRRNIVCRDKKNKDLGYANINQAQRAGSCWAVSNSDIGMEKSKRDNSSCIGFFLTKNGVEPIQK